MRTPDEYAADAEKILDRLDVLTTDEAKLAGLSAVTAAAGFGVIVGVAQVYATLALASATASPLDLPANGRPYVRVGAVNGFA